MDFIIRIVEIVMVSMTVGLLGLFVLYTFSGRYVERVMSHEESPLSNDQTHTGQEEFHTNVIKMNT
ncbi:hypothetical protein [Tuberibacillus sp. Marseille-P3662]|uniref:hypothetical protein n=1 Tax=Tuberibacillus sp. Marseille-P3662 TaxID=1965358 RepID=UPI000A1CA481|nr:hypothetical protein [Tuberibacillus sp. Marseille-P3662]